MGGTLNFLQQHAMVWWWHFSIPQLSFLGLWRRADPKTVLRARRGCTSVPYHLPQPHSPYIQCRLSNTDRQHSRTTGFLPLPSLPVQQTSEIRSVTTYSSVTVLQRKLNWFLLAIVWFPVLQEID